MAGGDGGLLPGGAGRFGGPTRRTLAHLVVIHAGGHIGVHAGLHAAHGGVADSLAETEISPEGEDAEVERGDGPDEVHDPHVLRMADLIDGDDDGAGDGYNDRYPGDGFHETSLCR